MGERPEYYTEVMVREQRLGLLLQQTEDASHAEGQTSGSKPWRRLAWRLGDLMLALGHRLTADRCCVQQKSASASWQA
jgi:hypothetical protein